MRKISFRCLIILAALLGSQPTCAQEAWELISPRLSGGSMESVRATATGLVLAVGQSGVVARSGDGGATWQRVQTGGSAWLYGVAISATDKCIAVGEAGTILTSSNGGESWIQRQTGVSGTLLAVEWVTDDVAIAGGQSGMLMKTGDAGLNWTQVTSGTVQQIESIHFLTQSVGYAAGGVDLLATTDAGTSWNRSQTFPGFSIQALHFADLRFGLMGDTGGRILRTSDGGRSWTTLLNVPNITWFTGISCIDSTTAILVGKEGILRTTDFGDTLTRVYGAFSSSTWILDVTFASPTRGFAVGHEGKILQTTDAGLTWTNRTQNIGANLTDIDFWSDSCGVVTSSDSVAYFTSDEGRTWTPKSTPTIFNNIQFLDALRGFATQSGNPFFTDFSRSSIWRTSNGGASWEFLFNNTPPGTTLEGIGFWDALRGCVIGSYYYPLGQSGNVEYYTSDGGNTWHAGTLSPPACLFPQFYSLSLSDSLSAYGINSGQCAPGSPYITRTTDAGLTWTRQNIDSFPQTNAIQFVNRMTGTAVGPGGAILRSEDGGVTWDQQQSPTPQDLGSVCFATRSHGVAVGSNGTIVSTADGGKHWVIEPHLTSQNLSKVFVSPKGNAIVIGAGGTIIRGKISVDPFVILLLSPADSSQDISTSTELRWVAATFAQKYRLQLSNDPSFESQHLLLDDGAVEGEYKTVSELICNTQYYWRVAGMFESGPGPWSSIFHFRTVPCNSIRLISPADSSRDISTTTDLKWAAATSAQKYRLQLSNDPSFESQHLLLDDGAVEGEYKTVSELICNTQYYWRVAGMFESGPGPWSPIFHFRTVPLDNIRNISRGTPTAPFLEQNYPNPFNSETVIRFGLAEDEEVSVLIYNTQGSKVYEISHIPLSGGSFELTWKPTNLASGVYFCSIKAGSFTQTKRMLFLK